MKVLDTAGTVVKVFVLFYPNLKGICIIICIFFALANRIFFSLFVFWHHNITRICISP